MSIRSIIRALLGVGLLALLISTASVARAAELKPETRQAFDSYIRLTQARIEAELRNPASFLWIDTLPPQRRREVTNELWAGKVVVERMTTREGDKDIGVPDGLIHDWLGTVFIPRATLQHTLALVQDYDRHKEYYKPDVIASKTLQHTGNDFRIFLRFYKKKVITVVLNTEHEVRYQPFDAKRMASASRTSKVAEASDPEHPDGPERPVGNDHGFMWALNSYWRFQERDGGVYVQCEAVSLSRGIPAGVSWLVKPFVTSVPRELLFNTLDNTRKALGQSTRGD